MNNNPFVGTTISTSKTEFEAQAHLIGGIPPGAKIVDCIIYATKAAEGKTSFELIKSSDKPEEGIRNIDSAKLESSQYFLLSAIRLETATVTVTEGDAVSHNQMVSADFSENLDRVVANGELEITVAGKTAFPRNSCRVFDNEEGIYKLEAPIMIAPGSAIIPTLRLGKTTDTATSKMIARIELIGTKLVSA